MGLRDAMATVAHHGKSNDFAARGFSGRTGGRPGVRGSVLLFHVLIACVGVAFLWCGPDG